jgi:hypothetical protein
VEDLKESTEQKNKVNDYFLDLKNSLKTGNKNGVFSGLG